MVFIRMGIKGSCHFCNRHLAVVLRFQNKFCVESWRLGIAETEMQ
jgi:hypothetical protein